MNEQQIPVTEVPQPIIRWSSDIPNLIQSNDRNKKIVIGLDRDGVINVDLGTYVTKPEDFEPIPGSLEAVATIKRLGLRIKIESNIASKDILSFWNVFKINLLVRNPAINIV